MLQNPIEFDYLIGKMSEGKIFHDCDAIIAIDARGFIFGTAISLRLSKPLIVARKPGKLPGELISKSYNLEYGTNSLSLQKNAIQKFSSFVIVDDLLATGGTVDCVAQIIKDSKKIVNGLSVLIELKELNARNKFSFEVESQFIL